MPFTISHAAVGVLHRPLRLPLAPLAIGSMAPDLPYFIGLRGSGEQTHALLGLAGIVVPTGIVLSLVWAFVLRPAVRDLSPAEVRRRWQVSAASLRRWQTWVQTAIAVALGALSHIAWDAFTHEDAWGTRSIAWLSAEHGPLPGYKWAQYGSGVVGLSVIAIALLVWWRRGGEAGRSGNGRSGAGRSDVGRSGGADESPSTAGRLPNPRLHNPRLRWALIGLPFVVAFITGVLTLALPAATPFSPAHGFTVLTSTMGAFAGGIVLSALLWHGLVAHGRSERPSG